MTSFMDNPKPLLTQKIVIESQDTKPTRHLFCFVGSIFLSIKLILWKYIIYSLFWMFHAKSDTYILCDKNLAIYSWNVSIIIKKKLLFLKSQFPHFSSFEFCIEITPEEFHICKGLLEDLSFARIKNTWSCVIGLLIPTLYAVSFLFESIISNLAITFQLFFLFILELGKVQSFYQKFAIKVE